MCRNKIVFNRNVYPLVERDQQIIPTYLRTKRVRRSSILRTWSTTDILTSTTNDSTFLNWWKNHCHTAQVNCDYFRDLQVSEQSNPYDMEISTLNMDRSSCILSNSIDRCHRNDSENDVTSRIFNNDLSVFRNGSPFIKVVNDHQFHSHNKQCASNGHQTVKRIRGSKFSDCFLVLLILLTLAVHQVFAKPMPQETNAPTLEDTLRSPCGKINSPMEDHSHANIKGVLQVIFRQSAIAKDIAREDVKNYLKITENSNVEDSTVEDKIVADFHYRWRIMEQAWLYPHGKKLPKEFNETVPMEIKNHFENAGRNLHIHVITKLLQECDERFQLLLIGFHNVLDDHNSKRSTMDLEKFDPLFDIFSRAKNYAQKVLCEIRMALYALGAPVTILEIQNIQSSKASNSNPNFYDWVVFREYINQLEHINEVVKIIFDNILE